jgi:serine protease inhibitor
VLLVPALLAGPAACGAGDDGALLTSDVPRAPVAVVDAPAVPAVVAATTALGAGLLAGTGPRENAVVSPASVAVVLSMLAEGAGGATAWELETVLGASGQDRTAAVTALLSELGDYAGRPAVGEKELPDRPVLHLATTVVVDEGRAVRQPYLDRLATGYGAGVSTVELSTAAGQAALDAWVAAHSGGRVERSAIEPGDSLVLAVQNAVVLTAAWASPFAPDLTGTARFTVGSGERVGVPTMRREGAVAYTADGPWQAVRLPYTDGFALDVVLPAAGRSPASLTGDEWQALDDALGADETLTEVALALPRVDLTSDLGLVGALQDAGVRAVFSPATADLRGIADPADGGPLFLGAAAHQAVLVIDEAGTVAAAATEAGVMGGAAPAVVRPVAMSVNRPFAVRLVHVPTGWPVFMGVVNDPRG